MKFKKLSLLLAMAITATTFVGCGSKSGDDSAEGDKSTGDKPAAEEQVLKIAALKGGYGDEFWAPLIEKFEAANEGVKVEVTAESNIEEVIRPQIQSGNVPDLIYLATSRPEALTETFIKEKALTDLSDVLKMTVPGEDVTVEDKILPGFLDTTATAPYGDGKTFLAPLFYGPTGLFFNKGLFEEKGYELPTTWDEFFALGDKAKEDGIYLFSYPVAGYFDCVFPAMIAAAGGVEAYNDFINYGEGFWTGEVGTKVLQTIGKLKEYTEPSVVSNANGQGFTKNQQLILDNKALFVPNGNWLPDEMKDAPRADGFEWGFMAYPAFEKGGDSYSYNFFEQMYIPAAAKNADLAKKFMAYMYSDEAVEIIAEKAKAAVPVVGAIDIAKKHLEPLQVELLQVYDNGALPIMGSFVGTEAVEGLDYKAVWCGTIDSIMSGDKTVEQWQKDLQDATDKMRAAIIK